MAAKRVEKTLRRMLTQKERLSKADAIRLKELILQDGYFSKSERKVILHAIENDLLQDSAFEVFLELILEKRNQEGEKTIA